MFLANNGDFVELYLNDKFLQRVETDLYSTTPCTLLYQPGELRAVSYKNGRIWAEETAYTPGAPAKIKLVCENRRVLADGTDTAIVSAYITDERGVVCSHETGRLARFGCNEAGSLLTTLSCVTIFTRSSAARRSASLTANAKQSSARLHRTAI